MLKSALLAPMLMVAQPAVPEPDTTTSTMAAFKESMDEWKVCTSRTVNKYATTTKEPAEAIVEAALGECSEGYQRTQLVLRNADSGRFMTTSDIANVMQRLMLEWRPKLFAMVLRLR